MNLGPKKQEFKPEQNNSNKQFRTVVVDWSTHVPDEESLVPYGKYVGKTLGWVISNDAGYSKWMYENNIIASWGLIKKKVESKKEPQPEIDMSQKFVTANGTVWVGIRETPGNGIKSQWI